MSIYLISVLHLSFIKYESESVSVEPKLKSRTYINVNVK